MKLAMVILAASLSTAAFANESLTSEANSSFTNDLPTVAISVPSNWQTISTKADFTFRTPSDLQNVPVDPIDSYVALYQGHDLAVMFDYGWYSASASEPNELISGKKAQITIAAFTNTVNGQQYDHYALVQFASIDRGLNNLTMQVYYKNAADLEKATTILRTIHFK